MKTDTTYLHKAVSDPQHQYWAEIDHQNQQDTDYSSQISSGASNMNRSVNNYLRDNEGLTICAFIILGCLIAWVIYRLMRNISLTTESDSGHQEMGEDTIYGHDWQREIDAKMAEAKYDEVIVLTYLKWLDTLNNHGFIEFHPSKTPNMFITEVQNHCAAAPAIPDADTDVLGKTKTLTHHYLRIRYGHKKSTAQLAQEIFAL